MRAAPPPPGSPRERGRKLRAHPRFAAAGLGGNHRSVSTNPRTGSLRSAQPRATALAFVVAIAGVAAACDQKEPLPPYKQRLHRGKSSGFDAADASAAAGPSPAAVLDRVRALLQPLPAQVDNPANPITDAKRDLGRTLYFDTRLSKNQDLSCNSCHVLASYGIDVREVDGKRARTSGGHDGQTGARNSPTVYNAALALSQFWDGRAADVEAQAGMPILNPVEMAMPDEASVVRVLKSIPGYRERFEAAFPGEADPITYANMTRAIGAFERKLMTPSRFDAFLKGDLAALEPKELEGLQLFVDVGCTQCHNGPGLGGAQFQKLGSVKPWPDLTDEGRGAITGNAIDRFVFRVPLLRNVAQTGPWLHDGSIAELSTMVDKMAEHQAARGQLTPAENGAIVAFLGSLTGELPAADIAAPELPPGGPDTPKADPSR
ncbi:MAG: c-type cytochrome [Deltaproteobacteria bacterium]|nr:c-type cytochrome [Deltaproteobacteria bacterium]